MPRGLGLEPHALEADALHPRPPAGGHQKPVAAQLGPLVQLEHVVGSVASSGGRVHTGVHLDPLGPEHLAHGLAELGGLVREHAIRAFHQGHRRAEAAHRLGHLHAHRAAPEDQEPLRRLLHAGDLAVGPDPVELPQPGHGRDEGIGPVGQDHVVGAQLPVSHGHAAGSGQAALAAHQVDALALGPGRLARVVVARHLEVAPRERRGHVQLPGHRLGRSRRLAGGLQRLARPQERLRRDARPVGALASRAAPARRSPPSRRRPRGGRRSARPASLHR